MTKIQTPNASPAFMKKLPRTIGNVEDAKQLIGASGSTGANYIEANEAIRRRDFVMKIKTCRREAKESGYWVRLLDCNGELAARAKFLAEARELTNIFGAIVRKSEVYFEPLNFEFVSDFDIRYSDFTDAL